MLTTTDFIFSYLRLQAKGKYYTLLERPIFWTDDPSSQHRWSRRNSTPPWAKKLEKPPMSNVGITPYAIAMLKSRDEPAPMDVR